MATITLGGTITKTIGELPEIGSKAPDFSLTATDLSTKTLSDFNNENLVLNIFPSVDTGVCDQSVRRFNTLAAEMNNAKVLCISRDLPFRQDQYCGAADIDNVVMLSDFKTGAFGKTYGLIITSGIFEALLSRCIIVINKEGIIVYNEQVKEIGDEPNYDKALEAVAKL